MATIPATQVGVPRGGLKADANSEHVEHVEHIERAVGQTANNASNGSDQKNIETVGYVVEEVNADFKLVPVILDEVRPNEVLVEMKYSGVCKLRFSLTWQGSNQWSHHLCSRPHRRRDPEGRLAHD